MTERKDGSNYISNYSYDALDRQTGRSFPADATLAVTYTYDETGHGKGIGRLTSMSDPAGTLSRTYDERGNILTSARTISGTTYTTTYTYTGANDIASITYPGAGWTVNYTRNSSAYITGVSVTPPSSSAITLASGIANLPYGPVYAMTFGNGATGSYTHDLDYRLTHLVDSGTGSLQNLTYAYDADDNVHTITDSLNAANSQTFGYDVLNRLTSAVSGTGGYGSLSYTYDNNGNRLTDTGTSYVYDSGNNILYTLGGASVTTSGSGSVRTIGSGTTLTYNRANQVTTAAANGTSATYNYDGFRQRLTVQPSGLPLQVYTYDINGHLLTETDNGTEVDYVYLNDTPIAVITPGSSTVSYLHTDRLGTPQLATSGSQAAVWQATYMPFGALSTATGSIIQNLRLPGQYADLSGFYHNGFRDYDPAIGRYLQSDPIGLKGGMNTYAYAGSNPHTQIDPQGLDGSAANWASAFFSAASMTWQWASGTGPDIRYFGPGSGMVEEMMSAPGVNAARSLYLDKNSDSFPCHEMTPVTNYAAKFGGPAGIITAGFNPAEQFIGSYRVDIYPLSSGGPIQDERVFVLTNTSSLGSFFFGHAPSHERSTSPFFGNTRQVYWWVEQ